MVGTLVNVGTIVCGSLIGGVFQKVMNEKLSDGLMNAMGFAAFGLGLNAIIQNMPKSNYPVLFITALQPQADLIMNEQSWRKPFKTRAELKAWCKDNQPYRRFTLQRSSSSRNDT